MSKGKNTVHWLVIGALCVMIGYLTWLTQAIQGNFQKANQDILSLVDTQTRTMARYSRLYRHSQEKVSNLNEELAKAKKLYDDSQTQLAVLRKELDTTQTLFVDAQALLRKAEEGKIDPQKRESTTTAEVHSQQISEKQLALKESLLSLEDSNKSLKDEIEQLKYELGRYQGRIETIEKARETMAFLKNRIRQIKVNIQEFQTQTQEARILAQKERDKIRLTLGNNGYLVKDGQPVKVDLAKYESALPEGEPEIQATKVNRKVGIDVTFFNN